MEYKILQFNKIKYVIRYPDGYDAAKKYPVLIYLHGAGGGGENIYEIVGATIGRPHHRIKNNATDVQCTPLQINRQKSFCGKKFSF